MKHERKDVRENKGAFLKNISNRSHFLLNFQPIS